MAEKIAVVGLGYVGLPVAVAMARVYRDTVGFDVNQDRIRTLQGGIDKNGDTPTGELAESSIKFTNDATELRGATFFIVAVPTPVDANNRPDLTALKNASELIGGVLQKGSVVVFESTVYPGVTENFCGPILERVSGLKRGTDFHLGYSPERINPGDREHTLEKITKVVSGEDPQTLERVAQVYGKVVTAGVHRASSIMVAEAAKVIENTQRDLNIALMNELAIIFERLNIPTRDVIAAARTKWNFLPFTPGLVGGHCIGVDPYYLTTIAEQFGYHPEVILAGRRINDGMGPYVAQRMVKLLARSGLQVKGSRVAILGITFKENVSDIRNSRVPSIIKELEDFGVHTLVHDPVADATEAAHEYQLPLVSFAELTNLDGLIFTVPHSQFLQASPKTFCERLREGGVFVDVKSAFRREDLRKDLTYWSL